MDEKRQEGRGKKREEEGRRGKKREGYHSS
jgi:hypothetical protein